MWLKFAQEAALKIEPLIDNAPRHVPRIKALTRRGASYYPNSLPARGLIAATGS